MLQHRRSWRVPSASAAEVTRDVAFATARGTGRPLLCDLATATGWPGERAARDALAQLRVTMYGSSGVAGSGYVLGLPFLHRRASGAWAAGTSMASRLAIVLARRLR